MLVVGFLEMAGVASIFPLITVLSSPEIVDSNAYLSFLFSELGFQTKNGFFVFLSSMVFLLIVVRALFTALNNYGLLRYSQMRSHSLSVRLLTAYLRRPYSFFIHRHSADMAKSVLSEVDQVVSGSLMPLLQLVSQFIVAVFIVGVVVSVDPLVAAIALISMVTAYGAVYIGIRGYLMQKGKERVLANRERYKIAQEVLSGVKEVKVAGLEIPYIARFELASLRSSKLRTNLSLVREIPRHALELIAVGGILAVVLMLLFRANGDLVEALPAMALYAFAGLRLLPAIQTLYQAVVSLRFGKAALDSLYSDLVNDDSGDDLSSPVPLKLGREIRLNSVCFTYPQAERAALKDVSLTIPVHTAIGLVGKTGAGKSTVVDVILGLLEPQSGTLSVDGTEIDRSNVRAWQRLIGYVPQQIFLADESIASNIALGLSGRKIDMAAVEKAARLANIHDFIVNELPRGYETSVGDRGIRLSGGQRQRIGIARALYGDPDVLILDEATSALDTSTEKEVMSAVRHIAQTKTIIMIAHRLTTVQSCNKIFILDNGELVREGPPSEVLNLENG
jgi:ABC-type bacteriocin/lantibiotic exporter with double-glycine peptidase domain